MRELYLFRRWGAVLVFCAVSGACREHRQLQLFPKAKPIKDEPCGEGKACPAMMPTCVDGSCAECVLDTDCKKDKPVCMQGRCVECATELDCPVEHVCNVGLARCTSRCGAPADCKEKGRARCDSTLGYCVNCTSDGDCKAPRSTCDVNSGTCVDCALVDPCPECVSTASCSNDAGASASGPMSMPAPPSP
jgi:hypothetical protein